MNKKPKWIKFKDNENSKFKWMYVIHKNSHFYKYFRKKLKQVWNLKQKSKDKSSKKKFPQKNNKAFAIYT